jgi:hypothetical protein
VKSIEVARKGKIIDMCGPTKGSNVTLTLMGRLSSFLQEMNDINTDPQ